MISRRSLAGAAAAVMGVGRARAGELPMLRVGDQKGGAEALMKAAAALNDLPYRLKWNQFAAAAPLLEALNADAVDLAFAGDAPVTFALAAGLPARIIAATRTSGAGTAIMVPDRSPIQGPLDLKGGTVGVNRGSIGHALVLAVAEAQGWRPSDITVANLLPVEAKTAVSIGAVDAWSSWGVYVAQARLIDSYRIVIDGSEGRLTGLSYAVATDTAIAAKRPALLDFSRRVAGARRWADGHRDAYAAVLAADIGVSQSVARLLVETETPLPVPIDAGVIADQQRTADRYTAAGIVRTRLDAARLFDPSFNAALAG
ncbi:MAG: ABC transporter substrate-binding protein [Acetobacteraceae bacterium]|nr:ABC transporter substrate-binding protein [Acetobacteraceae bacterium]